jgi:hypothetical protein
MSETTFSHDIPSLNAGYVPNPAGVRKFLAVLARDHPPELYAAAPGWLAADDGMTGDLMPYRSYLEVEVPGWKPKGAEPPYRPQTGYNCTSEGLGHGVDALQFVAVATKDEDDRHTVPVFHRVAVEATYAFGLYKAGMRGDRGCNGSPMAEGARDIGVVTYRDIDGADDEDGDRLRRWANDPASAVEALKDKAAPYRVGSVARVTTWAEYCAAIANRRIVTLASSVGYATPRDERGICRRSGRWDHQMFGWGVIRSDGVETGVIFQSWGKDNPRGPRPFDLPSFAFRARREDVEAQLAAGDSWAIGLFPGFERAPLPSRYTNKGWMDI